MPILPDAVRRALHQHDLLPTDYPVIVGVSGGPDSLALLHVLHHLGRYSLRVATLDHGLRADDGAADAQFVAAFARGLGVPVTVGTAVPNDTSEAAARRARYDFFAEVAAGVGAQVVAVAHHADDQAETVLMRLLRGAGLDGLAGMGWKAPMPFHPHLKLVRPLLGVMRAQIEAYCAEHGLTPRHDATNDDPTYTRNRLRHETLPHLRRYNPNLSHMLVHLADSAAVDAEFLALQVQALLGPHITQTDAQWTIDRAAFQQQHMAVQRRAIRWAVSSLAPTVDLGYERITAAVAVAARGEVGAIAELSGGLRLRVDYDAVYIERANAHERPVLSLEPGTELHIQVPGKVSLPDDISIYFTLEQPEKPSARLALRQGATLHLRTRRPGDRFKPLGMAGHSQKLSDWMINRKIPQAHRDHIPLLFVNDVLAAVILGAEWPVSQVFAVNESTKEVVYCYWTTGKSSRNHDLST